jgi:hypothetical protein
MRARDFPDRPSRLRSTFAFRVPGPAELDWLRARGPHVYEVAPVDDAAPQWQGDSRWLERTSQATGISGVLRTLYRYWAGDVSTEPTLETLVEGRLRVVAVCGLPGAEPPCEAAAADLVTRPRE